MTTENDDRAAVTSAITIPASAKDAQRDVDGSFRAYRWRVDQARKALANAEKTYAAEVERARKVAIGARTPAKIASIGIVRNVTLTETTISTPKGEFALTPDVTARAEQHGNKQVVQGWVFKSDNDRREVYLHIVGPTWGDAVPFSMKHSVSSPRDLHAFATKVNVAARNVEAARAAMVERTAAAERVREHALRARENADQAGKDLLVAACEHGAATQAINNAEAFLAGADPTDRRVRKLAQTLQAVHDQTRAWASEAVETHRRIQRETTAANTNADLLAGQRNALAIDTAAPPAPAAPEAAKPNAEGADLLSRL